MFPLTLTLSLGEREQPASAHRNSEASSALGTAEWITPFRRGELQATRLTPQAPNVFPLPGGEGRGEGEGTARRDLNRGLPPVLVDWIGFKSIIRSDA